MINKTLMRKEKCSSLLLSITFSKSDTHCRNQAQESKAGE
jgi:hypothetical protein